MFETALNRPALAFLGDHRVAGHSVLPTAALLEMAAAAGKVCRSCLPDAEAEAEAGT